MPSLGRTWIWLHKIPVPSVCSALPALLFLIFFLFISFLSWRSQCHLVTVLGSLRAQQRILDHPNRVGNSLLKLEVPLECWEHLAPGFLWFSPVLPVLCTLPAALYSRNKSGKVEFYFLTEEKLEGNPSVN